MYKRRCHVRLNRLASEKNVLNNPKNRTPRLPTESNNYIYLSFPDITGLLNTNYDTTYSDNKTDSS